jgi:Spy/CpxP family protein refolding chaperone
MRTLCKLTLILGAAALLVGSAQAQGPGFGRGGGGVGQLLSNKSVQEELKLNDEQKDKIKTAVGKVREDMKDDLAKLRDRDTKPEERAEIMKKVNEATVKALDGILSKDQDARLKQIQLQMQGIRAYIDADVQKALKLTDDQKDKIKTITDDTGKEVREAFQGINFQDREKMAEARKKVESLNKEATEKINAVLKDDQKKTYKEMTGEKFEYKPDARPGGGQRRNRQAQSEKKVDF